MRESLSFLTRRESLFFKQHAPGTNKLRRIVPHASAAIPAQSSGTTAKALALTIGAVVLTGVANRVLYKMALAPLGNYVFFLAQFQTFGYVAIYAAVLFLRHRAGLVSSKMLSLPRLMAPTFIAIGFVEALSSLLSFIGAAKLPGVVLPLLSQTVLFWQVLLAYTGEPARSIWHCCGTNYCSMPYLSLTITHSLHVRSDGQAAGGAAVDRGGVGGCRCGCGSMALRNDSLSVCKRKTCKTANIANTQPNSWIT